jgi:hypothetical protein
MSWGFKNAGRTGALQRMMSAVGNLQIVLNFDG